MQGPRYRTDIDGLRAVAVLPVVLFHAGIPLITGGFVGVDIFFVISGFLITGIIAREMQEDAFSILEFYRRRARRIFPALTIVVFASLGAGYLILAPQDFGELGESAATIALFGSNIYFWKSVSYFDPGIQPLLHTWSLAVEEQYYLFFPLLLIALRRRPAWIAPVLWGIFALSLVISTTLVAAKPSAAFYLLPSRAWELMLGGLLALGQFGAPGNGRQRQIVSILGLALICVPVLAYTPSTAFPGLAAVLPVAGAACMIWGHGWGLSSRPLVMIGRLSYSLYLWHLPVIEFAKYLTDAPLSIGAGFAASAVSLVLAGLTYQFVERPFRAGRHGRRRALEAAIGMPAVAAASLAIVFSNGVPGRLSPLQGRQLSAMGDEARHPSRCMTLDARWVDPARPCQFGTHPAILLWGDSHAMVTATSMAAAGVDFLFAADADCPIGKNLSISPDFEPGLVSQGHYRRCGDYNRAMLRRALRDDVKTVVLSSRWTNWRIGEPPNPAEDAVDIRLQDDQGVSVSGADNRRKFESAFAALIDELTAAGKRVVIVGPMPEPAFNVPQRLFVSGFGLANRPLPITDYRKHHRVILSYFSKLQDRGDVAFIWPAQALCRDAACPVVKNDLPIFFDHNHLTVAAAQSLAPLYVGLSKAGRPPTSPAGLTRPARP